ncbi:hypothetical protein FRB91_005575 [Serendipita sp. 411]|nr:hypothetical protein FRB91_005575 [Serendipita sp. 411]
MIPIITIIGQTHSPSFSLTHLLPRRLPLCMFTHPLSFQPVHVPRPATHGLFIRSLPPSHKLSTLYRSFVLVRVRPYRTAVSIFPPKPTSHSPVRRSVVENQKKNESEDRKYDTVVVVFELPTFLGGHYGLKTKFPKVAFDKLLME